MHHEIYHSVSSSSITYLVVEYLLSQRVVGILQTLSLGAVETLPVSELYELLNQHYWNYFAYKMQMLSCFWIPTELEWFGFDSKINTFYFSSLSSYSNALKFNMLLELKFYHVWHKACSHTILGFSIKEQTTKSPWEFCTCWYLGTTIPQSKQMTFLLGSPPPNVFEHYTFFEDNTGMKFKGIYIENFYDSTVEIIPL